MGIFDPDDVITEYSIRLAVEMGALVQIFKERWIELSGGKPIVSSANVFEFESKDVLLEVWNRYIFWQKYILPKSEDGFFSTEIGWQKIWIFDDRVCFTMMYPEDY